MSTEPSAVIRQTVEDAIRHCERGWALLPIAPRLKQPNASVLRAVYGRNAWAPLREHPACADEVREWFRIDPGTNIGVICGAASGGLVVADFDRAYTGTLPATVTAATSRGIHAYYRSDLERAEVRPWGELKASGYVLLPPSVHPDGTRYAWRRSPDEIALAPLPDELLHGDALTPPITPPAPPTYKKSCGDSVSPSPSRIRLDRLDLVPAHAPYVERLARLTGIRIDGNFCCLLHGESHPSACLWRAPDGRWVYRCFHGRGPGSTTLTNMYASWKIGRVVRLKPVSHAVWTLRALRETGFLEPARVTLPTLPWRWEDRWGQVVWEAASEIFGLRWAYEPGVPIPLAREFLAHWIGMSPARVRAGLQVLLDQRIIAKAGEIEIDGKRTPVYLPGNGTRGI